MQVSFDAGDFTEKPRCETCLYWDRYNGQGVCEKTDEKKWPGDVCDDWSQPECSNIAKYRHPEYPNEWFLTDFTMVQVEGRLRLLEEQNKRMFLVCKMALGFLQMFLDQNCTDECKSYAKNLQENLVGAIGG